MVITFPFYLAVSVGVSVRVGNLLGEGKPMEAKRAAIVGWFISGGE